MAKNKYKEMGLEYVLEDVPDATQAQAVEAKNIILDAMRKERRAMAEEK